MCYITYKIRQHRIVRMWPSWWCDTPAHILTPTLHPKTLHSEKKHIIQQLDTTSVTHWPPYPAHAKFVCHHITNATPPSIAGSRTNNVLALYWTTVCLFVLHACFCWFCLFAALHLIPLYKCELWWQWRHGQSLVSTLLSLLYVYLWGTLKNEENSWDEGHIYRGIQHEHI